MNVKQIQNINLTMMDSQRIELKLSSPVAQVIRKINQETNHKHLTNGIIISEMLNMFSDLEIENTSMLYEEELDSRILKHKIDPKRINNHSRGNLTIPDDADKEKMVVFIPKQLSEKLNEKHYFKSEYIEDIVQKYYSNPFSSVLDRIKFKKLILKGIEEDIYYKDIDMSKRYKEILKNNKSLKTDMIFDGNWYSTLNSSEVIQQANQYTKETREDRLKAIDIVIDKTIEEAIEFVYNSDNKYAMLTTLENSIQFNTKEELVDKMFNVSETTISRYIKEFEFSIEGLQSAVIDELDTEELVKDTGLKFKKDSKSRTKIPDNVPLVKVKKYVEENGNVEFTDLYNNECIVKVTPSEQLEFCEK